MDRPDLILEHFCEPACLWCALTAAVHMSLFIACNILVQIRGEHGILISDLGGMQGGGVITTLITLPCVAPVSVKLNDEL